jgi:hypothetical protein
MKLYALLMSQNISGAVLYLIITLANIDYVGILDYAIKATLGSLIWFGFKVWADYYAKKINKNNNEKPKQP